MLIHDIYTNPALLQELPISSMRVDARPSETHDRILTQYINGILRSKQSA